MIRPRGSNTSTTGWPDGTGPSDVVGEDYYYLPVNPNVLVSEDDQVDTIVDIVRTTCTSRTQIVNPMPPIMEPGEFFMPYPLEVEVGGATVFVVPVERFERL